MERLVVLNIGIRLLSERFPAILGTKNRGEKQLQIGLSEHSDSTGQGKLEVETLAN